MPLDFLLQPRGHSMGSSQFVFEQSCNATDLCKGDRVAMVHSYPKRLVLDEHGSNRFETPTSSTREQSSGHCLLGRGCDYNTIQFVCLLLGYKVNRYGGMFGTDIKPDANSLDPLLSNSISLHRPRMLVARKLVALTAYYISAMSPIRSARDISEYAPLSTTFSYIHANIGAVRSPTVPPSTYTSSTARNDTGACRKMFCAITHRTFANCCRTARKTRHSMASRSSDPGTTWRPPSRSN